MTTRTRRFRLAAGVGALTILVAAVIGIALSAPAPGSPGAAESTAGAGSAPPAASTATPPAGDPSSSPDAGSGQATSPEAPAAAPDGAPDAEPGTPPEPATEIPPVVDDSAAPTTGLPPSTPVPALLTGPAPAPATAQNKVVDGFPEGIPVAERSTVASSDVTVENERVRVSLTATTPTAGAEILAQYDAALARFGFDPTDAPAVGGSTARSYNRGAESVTVTVTPADGGGSGYSILALLVASE